MAPYFHDDGTEFFPDLLPKPGLCISCEKDDYEDSLEEVLCNLNRMDQAKEETFECGAYIKRQL
jgi:hypothetical protein